MRIPFYFFIIFLCSFFTIYGQSLSTNTTGSFTYVPAAPLNTKPVEVFYHIPAGDMSTMPIVLSFHGADRNGSDYRNYWISMANANGFMVFAPQFLDTYYPTGDKYQSGNIFDDGDNPSFATYNPVNEWTFSIIDPLFEYIKADVSGTQQVYNAWGHSGGAQFLHRFVEYIPNSKLDIAVCSNSGWYTVPEYSVNFPYGLQEGQLPNATLTAAFLKKLIIHLGQNDTDPNSSGLRHNTVVDNQQGLNRYVRGNYFFTTSQTTAQTMSVPFNWEKHEVPAVNHDAQAMANNALQYILFHSLNTKGFSQGNPLKAYPNPASHIVYFNNSNIKCKKAKLLNIIGSLVEVIDFENFEAQQRIDISNHPTGLYFLKLENITIKIIKK
jgi:hypothetical protein